MNVKSKFERFKKLQKQRSEEQAKLEELAERQEELKERLIEASRPPAVQGTDPFDSEGCRNPPRFTPEQRQRMRDQRKREERKGGFYGGNTRPIDRHDMNTFTLEWGPQEGKTGVFDHWDRLHAIGHGPINDEGGYVVHGVDCDCMDDEDGKGPEDCLLVRGARGR